jgi:hypothetical protein
MVEAGVRRILQDALGPHRLRKQRFQLADSSVSFNPDLVFDDGTAVGDVKYKLSSGDWNRQDLYQAIAFAEAFGAEDAVVVRFRTTETASVRDAHVGGQIIHEVTWLADSGHPAAIAAASVADAVAEWLSSVDPQRLAS